MWRWSRRANDFLPLLFYIIMPRAAASKRTTAAKPKKPARKATASKKAAAAPRKRATFRAASGETLKENASQLEVAERMLAELASRDQAEKDPAVAAQRALRSAILTGAVSPNSIVLKSAPAMKTNEEIAEAARPAADKAAAAAAKAAAKVASKATKSAAKAASAAAIASELGDLKAMLASIASSTGALAAETDTSKMAREAEERRVAAEKAKAAKAKDKAAKAAAEAELKRLKAEAEARKRTLEERARLAEEERLAIEAELRRITDDEGRLTAESDRRETAAADLEAENRRIIARLLKGKKGATIHTIDAVYNPLTGLVVNIYNRQSSGLASKALTAAISKRTIVERGGKFYSASESIPEDPSGESEDARLAREREETERMRLAAEAELARAAAAATAAAAAAAAEAGAPKIGLSAPSTDEPKGMAAAAAIAREEKLKRDREAAMGKFAGVLGTITSANLRPPGERIFPVKPPIAPTGPPSVAERMAANAKKIHDAHRGEDPDWPEEPVAGAGRGKGQSEIHSAGFPQNEWTPAQARRWLTEHGAKPIKPMRREGSWLRWRLTPPDRYGRYTTRTLRSNGKAIHLVMGWR